MWIRIVTLALVIGLPVAGRAEPVLLSPLGAIESSTNTITEPLVDGGMFLARSCFACSSLPLRLTAQTELFIGERLVTINELNKFLSATSEGQALLILYDKKASTVARLVVQTDDRS